MEAWNRRNLEPEKYTILLETPELPVFSNGYLSIGTLALYQKDKVSILFSLRKRQEC